MTLFAGSVLFAGGVLFARDADAEQLRLRSGQVLEAAEVEVRADGFRVRIEKDGASSFVDLPFDRFPPKTALRLFDRHTDPSDGRRRLQSGEIALGLGLAQEATRRFEKAAALDPALKTAAAAGVASVQRFRAQAQFQEIEDRLRASSYPTAERAALEALLTGEHASALTPALRKRIGILIELAKRIVEREDERKAKKAAAPPPKKKPEKEAEPAPPPTPPDRGRTNVPGRRTYADQRYRSRRGPRPAPPRVPGAERPRSPASGGAARGSSARGSSTPGGGTAGGGLAR